MRKFAAPVVFLLFLPLACAPQPSVGPEVSGWEQQAQNVTIIRDDWGIAHIYGKTDADAVFGMIYSQAEDDFNRVEQNFLLSMGRLAEAEGESEIYRDLRMKLFIDPDAMRAMYGESPQWLKDLMDSWAAGLNYYLHSHPEVTPRVITRWEPWMALTFSEGSIGGDIERVSLGELEAFYGKEPVQKVAANLTRTEDLWAEPSGSNGLAIAPANSASGNALFWINPHTSFFFRSELHMVSEEGLNAYGAVTWGQFFVYQGFNEKAGWMHTSSGIDNIDEYMETVTEKDGVLYYRYGEEERPLTVNQISVPYRTARGMESRDFTIYRTHHGPVVREADGKWISVRLMEEPMKALMQSYGRTKVDGIDDFREVMELHTNSSNNTVYADADGNIAYWHANFAPKRDTQFDWTKPVDGANPATEWGEPHSIDESPNTINPPNGWVQNTNNWPYSAAGPHSPKREDYPAYMDRNSENPRGELALRVLHNRKDFTLESLTRAAFDTYLTGFEPLMPPLLKAYGALPGSSPLKSALAEQIALLGDWDLRWSTDSVPTALAIYWAEELGRQVRPEAREAGVQLFEYMATRASNADRLKALETASQTLAADFGSWKTPWGDINRFQRLTPDIVHPFDDKGASISVGFPSGRWGSLASFGARTHDTKKRYGTSGNSFVAAVEFGDRVRATAITAGGQSGDPSSPHFNDQAERYATGNLREVYFYREQLEGHAEREYHPGQ